MQPKPNFLHNLSFFLSPQCEKKKDKLLQKVQLKRIEFCINVTQTFNIKFHIYCRINDIQLSNRIIKKYQIILNTDIFQIFSASLIIIVIIGANIYYIFIDITKYIVIINIITVIMCHNYGNM